MCPEKRATAITRVEPLNPKNKQSRLAGRVYGPMCDRNARHKYLEEAQIVSPPFTLLQQKHPTAGCRLRERMRVCLLLLFPFASP
jgi:hypothetical protein